MKSGEDILIGLVTGDIGLQQLMNQITRQMRIDQEEPELVLKTGTEPACQPYPVIAWYFNRWSGQCRAAYCAVLPAGTRGEYCRVYYLEPWGQHSQGPVSRVCTFDQGRAGPCGGS